MNKQRKVRFIIFALIFLVISPIILMYAFGNFYGADGFFKTGGIYVITSEPDTEIYLDGKLKKTSNFFQRSFLIKNLSPKGYSVLVKKDGYNSWTKDVMVNDGLVTEVKAFMLPEIIELRLIANETQEFGVNGTTSTKNIEYDNLLEIFDSGNVTRNRLLSTTSSDVSNLGTADSPIIYRNVGIWKEGGKIFASWVGRKSAIKNTFCDGLKCNMEIEVYSFDGDLGKIDFFLGDTDAVIAQVDKCLYAIETQKNTKKIPQKIFCGENIDFIIENNNYLYLRDGSALYEVII